MTLDPARASAVRTLLARVPTWATQRPDVTAVGLCGSWAAARARDDSDVDLVVLTTRRADMAAETGWLAGLCGGAAALDRVRDWGPHLTEVRAVLADGLEVEIGLADPAWAAVDPVDPGTGRVVTDGWVTLYDPGDALGPLTHAVHRRPPADVDVTGDLVRRLLAEQHPDLAGRSLVHADGGWDNEMYRLGDDLAVRLPRRLVAAGLTANEHRWLPRLAPLLRLRLPAPVRVGHPTGGYPYPWGVVPWLPGVPAWREPVAGRTAWAADLADALADLHVAAPADAPVNPFRSGPLTDRDEAVRQRLLVPMAGRPDTAPLDAVWRDALAAPAHTGPATWVHGDPHPANLLVEDGRLVALVDFGDLTAGDPATDLATAWLTFDAAGRAAFRARLGERGAVDDATWRRARGWALSMGLAMVRRASDPAIGAIGRHALRQLAVAP